MQLQEFVPVYPDRLLRLTATPILGIMYRHIGEPSPLIHLLRDPVYYIDLTVCIISIALIWELIKQIIRQLDKRYSWINDFYQRLFLQALAVYGVAILLVVLITFLYNDIVMKEYRHEKYDITFSFVTDVPVTILILTIQQLLYYALYLQAFYQNKYPAPEVIAPMAAAFPQDARPAAPKNLLVDFGKSLLPISIEEIAYFHKTGDITLVRTFEGKDYRLDQTLEQLQADLPPNQFYRLNRQMIAHIGSIREVKSDASGKLLIGLTPPYNDLATVSRKKAAEFKHWLKG